MWTIAIVKKYFESGAWAVLNALIKRLIVLVVQSVLC